MAATTEQEVAANAAYHTELLTNIAELDYVSAALSNQTSYVNDLEKQFAQSRKKLNELQQKTKKERKEHEALKDSTARRLAHKLTGRKEKFEAMESKEEREFVEALEREITERDNLEVIEQMLVDAQQVYADLKSKATRHESLKTDLANLYSRVFDGPSEAYPEEDQIEYQLDRAYRHHEQVQRTLNQEMQAAEILSKAVNMMNSCQGQMQEALSYSRWDMWGGGGMSDMMERNALRSAQALAYQAENLVDQARRISPQVEPVARVNIAQGSVISDVFFDNIFTDMAFHNKIKTSAAQVLLANNRLKAERDAAMARAETAGSQLNQAAKTLQARRGELDGLRRGIFLSVSSALGPEITGRPPSYNQAVIDNGRAALSSASTASALHSTTSEPRTDSPNDVASRSTSLPRTPSYWGSRNPYAAAMAERTRSNSLELQQ
ncbi:hypothetical protein BDQ17DRAFT_1410589 [Cyathus striatus]|nr:hypothetical protein BDQ17DRAFT_1410589 [Cyathus striatus]